MKTRMTLSALVIIVLAALVAPAPAPARIIEVGNLSQSDLPAPSCPTRPCFAVSRTTGYQAKVGTNRGLMKVPAKGRIVAWTMRLSKPSASQVRFFNRRLGGAPKAQLTVLKPGKRLFSRVVAMSPLTELTNFLGQTVQFPLETSIPVRKGQVVGLTVPTWAPALVTGVGSDTSWRASRLAGDCDDTEAQTAQAVRDNAQYRCLYQRVRLSYSATIITDPEPNTTPPRRTRTRRG